MTVNKLIEQARALTAEERKELIDKLLSMESVSPTETATTTHWGQQLNQLLDTLDVEFKYPDIDDPVAWVKHHREEERRRRLGDWGEQA